MSSRGHQEHHGLRWSLGKHGFVFRLNHSEAFNGYSFIENDIPPLYYEKFNLNESIAGFEVITPIGSSSFTYISNSKVNGSLSTNKNKENDVYISGNQFCFLWSYDLDQAKWVAGDTVFSWFHSSHGDGPVGKIYDGEIGNFYEESNFEHCSYVGICKNQVGMNELEDCFKLFSYSGIYRDSNYSDSIQGVDTPSYSNGILSNSLKLQSLTSAIYKNGKIIIDNRYINKNTSSKGGMSDLTSRITEIDDVDHVSSTTILGCHAVNNNRLFVILGVVYNNTVTYNDEYRVYFLDVNGFGENSVVKLGSNNDNSYLATSPYWIETFPSNKGWNGDVFTYPWRFSQDGTQLSCLTIKNEFSYYTLSNPTLNTRILKKGIVLTTYTISHDNESDSYSVTQTSSTEYSPYLLVSRDDTTSYSGINPTEIVIDSEISDTFVTTNMIDLQFIVKDCNSWPIALNYKNNVLCTAFIEVPSVIFSGSGTSNSSNEWGSYEIVGPGGFPTGEWSWRSLNIHTNLSSSFNGFIIDEDRGITGNLKLPNGYTINLCSFNESINESSTDKFAGWNIPWNAESTKTASIPYYIDFIDVANNIVIYGKRNTQLSATLNTNESFYTFVPSGTFETEEVYTQGYNFTYVGGTEFYIFNNGTTETLALSSHNNSYIYPENSTSQPQNLLCPYLSIYDYSRDGLRYALSPYFGVFNHGACSIGLFRGTNSNDKNNFFSHTEKVNYNIGYVFDPRKEANNSVYWVDLRQINTEMLIQASLPENADHYEYFNGFPSSLFDRINVVNFKLTNSYRQEVADDFLNELETKYNYLTFYPIGLF